MKRIAMVLMVVAACGEKTEPEMIVIPPAETSDRPAPRQSIVRDAHWWCTETQTGGSCYRLRGDCDRHRSGLLDLEPTPCKGQPAAACYMAFHRLGQGNITLCYPSFALCRSGRDFVIANERDDVEVRTQCERLE